MRILQSSQLLALPDRPVDAHKGLFGHVLVIGGGILGYAGAPILAGYAALRTGAGLVSLVVPPQSYPRMAAAPIELMCYGLENADALLKQATVIIIGPGLSQSAWAEMQLALALASNTPLVIDADGLNLIVKLGWKERLHQRTASTIITPHPGEAAYLLNCDIADIQQDREKAVISLAQEYQAVSVLKGAGSLIVSPNNLSDVAICKAGNPGMATAGMGDVLSGIIGSFLAQGMQAQQAAEAGVLIHALAGDAAAIENGTHGIIASDLIKYIHLYLP